MSGKILFRISRDLISNGFPASAAEMETKEEKQDGQEQQRNSESSSPQQRNNEGESEPVPPEEPNVANAPANEPDSTVAEDPVNLKMDGGNEEAPTPANQPEEIRNSPPPLHHVRTITLTSDYRQQEQENLEAAQLTNQEMSANNTTTLYVEEAAVDGQQEGVYYQPHHYTDENGTTVRYREIVSHKANGHQMELIDAAAAAAGVPTGPYILMEGEEDDQDDRTSAFLGSRLATFQVFFN